MADLRIDGLHKRFGAVQAIADLSLDIPSGVSGDTGSIAASCRV